MKKESDYLGLTVIQFLCICLFVVTLWRPAGGSVVVEATHLNTILQVRRLYTSQIGVRETHTNSGSEVEQYLRYVNLPKGNPWCAAFVCWVYGKAGVANPRSGWLPDLFGEGRVIWARRAENGKLKTENADQHAYVPSLATRNWQPLPNPSKPSIYNLRFPIPTTGDVFGLFFPEKARIAHVGFIDQWDGNWLITVEGNTNVSGSREGDGVHRKRRLVRSVYKVARYVE